MKTLLRILIMLLLWANAAWAEPLLPEQAFVFTVYLQDKDHLSLQWTIAPNYYLYKDRIAINAAPNTIAIENLTLPKGHMKKNAIRGEYAIYTGLLQIPVALQTQKSNILDVTVHYQGCSLDGFCYAPIKKHLTVNLQGLHPPANLTTLIGALNVTKTPELSEQDYAEKLFDGQNLFIIVISFIGLGLLLSLTPCVLPMVPILSAIIMGHRRKLTTLKTFLLSLSYVLGMALTYALAGVGVALLGSRIQTALQKPWVIVTFSAIFVLLALSLFGLYELRLPQVLQKRLTALSNRQKGGTYFGVFLMGSISSLIVSPCISAPLVGVLAYIGHTGNVLLGATALLALGWGMGIPLLLLGASAGSLLPRAGNWMLLVERLMGFFMLAFAIWMLNRVWPGSFILFLWAALLIGFALYLGLFKTMNPRQHFRQAFGLLAFTYGIILLIGAFFGNSDPLNPWANWKWFSFAKTNAALLYVDVKDPSQLDNALQLAKKDQQPVMLDFYADWCQSCIKMERTVFQQPPVIALFKGMVLLRVDVTHDNAFDRMLMKRFNVIAPPTFVFFNRKGDELTDQRIVGEINTARFIAHLTKIKES